MVNHGTFMVLMQRHVYEKPTFCKYTKIFPENIFFGTNLIITKIFHESLISLIKSTNSGETQLNFIYSSQAFDTVTYITIHIVVMISY